MTATCISPTGATTGCRSSRPTASSSSSSARPAAGRGEFVRPAGITVDHDFDIYVCDWGNNRIQLFTPEGRYVQQFTGDATLSEPAIAAMRTRLRTVRLRTMADLETEKMFRGPRSVRVDENGLMWVPDFESYRLQVYRKEAFHLEPHQLAPPLRPRRCSRIRGLAAHSKAAIEPVAVGATRHC